MEGTQQKFNKLGPNQKKILLLLAGGVGLAIAGSPKAYFGVIKSVSNEWEKINEQSLKRSIRALYQSKLIEEKENENGSVTLVLSDAGKKKVLTYDIDTLSIQKLEKWDGKWRMVLFDIPNSKKKEREILRATLKRIGFAKYQESVFVLPYECKKEFDYIVEFYNLRPHVRLVEAVSFDDDLKFKNDFGLLA